jgi:hypothetical protein
VKQVEKLIENALNEMDNPALAAVSCSVDYFKCLCIPTDKYLEQIGPIFDKYRAEQEGLDELVNIIIQSAHSVSVLILQGKALSQTAMDIEIGDSEYLSSLLFHNVCVVYCIFSVPHSLESCTTLIY